MSERIYIKPARQGMTVVNPADYSIVPQDGCEVVADGYWHRRIADGDIIIASPKAQAKPKAEGNA